MSGHADLEHIVETASEGAATPHLRVVRERRAVRESGGEDPGLNRRLAAGLLGGAVVIYGVLGVLIYEAVAAFA
jgi:hypothetical protein